MESVLYVPEACHGAAWEWVKGHVGKEKPAEDHDLHNLTRDTEGQLITASGQVPVRPSRPKVFWPAVLVSGDEDGASLDISVPESGVTLHYDHRKYSKDKEPGTWHRKGD